MEDGQKDIAPATASASPAEAKPKNGGSGY